MVIFWRELRRNWKSFLIWALLLIGLNGLTMAFYPTVAKESEQFTKILEQMPGGLRAAFNLDQLNIGDILGYFGTRAYMLVTLFGSIYVMLLAAGIIAKEEGERTIEFLLAKPVTRNTVVTAKALCVLVYVVLFNLVFALTNLIFFEIVKQGAYDHGTLLLLSVGPLLLHLTFAAAGLLLSASVTKGRGVLPLALGIILGTYFANILASLTASLAFLKYFSPFRYIDAADLITNGKIAGIYLGIIAITIPVLVGMTYLVYNRKEIVV